MKRALVMAAAFVLVASHAFADSPGDLVARMSPGVSDAPAKALATGTFDVEQLGAELDLLAKTGDNGKVAETLQAVAKAAGANYWRDDFDLVAGLVALPENRGAKRSDSSQSGGAGGGAPDHETDPDAYKALLGTACILQALAKDGRKEAVARMIRVVPDHGGVLRFEIARRMKALGEKAVAPLILARQDKATRGFAWQTLDAMQKKIPGDAVQTKSNEILAAILLAYGETKDADALGAVMSFIGSERDEIRAASRTAVLAYGDAALAKLRETYGNVMNAPPPSDWTSDRIARALFDVLDKQRNVEIDALVDDGLARAEKDDVEGAVADFDKVLARVPFIAHRNLMAPAYAKLAWKLEDTDRDGARVAFRKSLDLDPNGTHATESRAELEVMDGEDLAARGIEDRAPFERALQIDPANAKARAALDRIDAKAKNSEDRSRKWTWAALFGGAFLAVLVLFGRIPRRFRRA